MVTGDVDYAGAIAHEMRYFFNNTKMRSGKIVFAELPDIDDIAIQDQHLGGNATEVAGDFFCAAAISAQMQIRQYHYINRSFFHLDIRFTNIPCAYYRGIAPVLMNCKVFASCRLFSQLTVFADCLKPAGLR